MASATLFSYAGREAEGRIGRVPRKRDRRIVRALRKRADFLSKRL